jgi:hypothetical protein
VDALPIGSGILGRLLTEREAEVVWWDFSAGGGEVCVLLVDMDAGVLEDAWGCGWVVELGEGTQSSYPLGPLTLLLLGCLECLSRTHLLVRDISSIVSDVLLFHTPLLRRDDLLSVIVG